MDQSTSDQVQAKIETFAQQLAEEFGEIDEENGLSWLDAIETRAVAIGDAVTTELLKRRSADPPVEQDESTCQRQRELIGRRGPVTITEPEYFCPCCRKSFFPEHDSARGGD